MKETGNMNIKYNSIVHPLRYPEILTAIAELVCLELKESVGGDWSSTSVYIYMGQFSNLVLM